MYNREAETTTTTCLTLDNVNITTKIIVCYISNNVKKADVVFKD